ncbi:MAG: amidohydrolase [Chloroflexota bacterium]
MNQTMLLYNGRIYTIDPAQPTATAVAIGDGNILAVGSDDDLAQLSGVTERIDLNGRCVIPGLVDAHVHFKHLALARQRVNLDGCQSLAEVMRRIQQRAEGEATSSWLQGWGWAQDQWIDRTFPTAAALDQIVADRPTYLTHKSGHAAWANSRALQLAGVTATTADPAGGQIQRDDQGQPTGILFEEAMKLVSTHIPPPTAAETVAAMRQAQAYCWQVGLTGVHDFDGRSCFQALQTLHQNGELGLRVIKNIPVALLQEALGVGLRSGFGDDWLRLGGIKIFADGALGPKTAAMVEPYEGEPDNRGIVVVDKEEMLQHALQASAGGLSLTVHAIGDRANHDVLDVYEAVRRQEQAQPPGQPLRHRIEHVQLLHPSDLGRLAKLNVIASMQPTHATSDMETADRYWGERTRTSYAWRTMLDTGATLVFGSDAPIEAIDPLPGLHAAVTRRRADGFPDPDGWHPEQRLTMAEAVHAFTLAAAQTSSQTARLGSISPGKLADLTLFSRDIFTMPPDELLAVEIVGTMVNGRFAHRTF